MAEAVVTRRRFLRVAYLFMVAGSGLCLVGAAASAPPAPARPFLRFTLAGADVRDGLAFVKRDAKAGYYLSARVYGDKHPYESVSLSLSPERDDEAVEDVPRVQAATLPRLRSGRGVNVGDAPSVVRRKLGALPTTTSYDRRTKELVYTFEAVFPLTYGSMVRRRMSYVATYTFHSDQLWAIQYSLSDPSDA